MRRIICWKYPTNEQRARVSSVTIRFGEMNANEKWQQKTAYASPTFHKMWFNIFCVSRACKQAPHLAPLLPSPLPNQIVSICVWVYVHEYASVFNSAPQNNEKMSWPKYVAHALRRRAAVHVYICKCAHRVKARWITLCKLVAHRPSQAATHQGPGHTRVIIAITWPRKMTWNEAQTWVFEL